MNKEENQTGSNLALEQISLHFDHTRSFLLFSVNWPWGLKVFIYQIPVIIK